jgi:phosphatidate cytidylyltransferase
MLSQRLITAAVGIPIILAIIYLGGALYTAIVAVILAIAAIEFVHMLTGTQRPVWRPTRLALAAAAVCAAMAIAVDAADFEWPPELVILVAIAMVFVIVRGVQHIEVPDWATVPGAAAYIGLLGSYFVLLRGLDDDGNWVFWAVICTWLTDTSAYATGKLVGRHKMAPSISPGKTWEGTAGAIVGGFAAMVAVGLLLDLPVSVGDAIVLGLLLPGLAVVADLAESVLKRSAGVKDTSEMVPGHGGFLDRLDSLLFTVPLVYLYAVWVVK